MRFIESLMEALSFNRLSILFPLFLWGLLIYAGCGPREDPELVRERQTVTSGIELLRSGTAVQRDSVIRTFYKLKNPSVLHTYLNDPDSNIQIGVISAIGYLKDGSAAHELNSLLTSVEDYLLRETIIYAIGELSDTSSVPVLVGLLENDSTNRDLRLSIPITLASFSKTEAAGQVEQAFSDMLQRHGDDLELCSYISVGILEVLNPGNVEKFRQYLPLLRQLADKRKAESGEDGIWTNFQLTIEELQNDSPPAS